MAKFRNQLKEAMDLKLYQDGIQRLKNLTMRSSIKDAITSENSDVMSGIFNVEISNPDFNNESLSSQRAQVR